MTKDEYLQLKAKIFESFGLPEWDNHEAVNESAKRLSKLMTEYRLSCRTQKAQAEKEKKEQLKDLASPDIKKRYKDVSLPTIALDDKWLVAFTEQEKDIVTAHFEDMALTHKQLANKCNTSRQIVTALLNTQAFKILEEKLFNALMPSETRIALLKATRGGDSRIVQRLAEHYRILNPEKMELEINKAIEDPKALEMLKKLGDSLAEGEHI